MAPENAHCALDCCSADTFFLILQATERHVLPEFRAAMASFVLPLTAITLAVVAARAMRRGRTGPGRDPS